MIIPRLDIIFEDHVSTDENLNKIYLVWLNYIQETLTFKFAVKQIVSGASTDMTVIDDHNGKVQSKTAKRLTVTKDTYIFQQILFKVNL